MKVLRLIKGVTRLDRHRNEDIRRELGVESILDFVERGQLRWFGHVKRMGDERYPKRMLEWTPPRKKASWQAKNEMARKHRERYCQEGLKFQ